MIIVVVIIVIIAVVIISESELCRINLLGEKTAKSLPIADPRLLLFVSFFYSLSDLLL